MSDEMTRAQKIFLRNLTAAGGALPPNQWPSPLVLRRWLRNRTFQTALVELREAIHFRADLHLASASARAAATLDSQLATPAASSARPRDLLYTLRIAHQRQRHQPRPEDQKPFKRPSWFKTDAEFDTFLNNMDQLEQTAIPVSMEETDEQERIEQDEHTAYFNEVTRKNQEAMAAGLPLPKHPQPPYADETSLQSQLRSQSAILARRLARYPHLTPIPPDFKPKFDIPYIPPTLKDLYELANLPFSESPPSPGGPGSVRASSIPSPPHNPPTLSVERSMLSVERCPTPPPRSPSPGTPGEGRGEASTPLPTHSPRTPDISSPHRNSSFDIGRSTFDVRRSPSSPAPKSSPHHPRPPHPLSNAARLTQPTDRTRTLHRATSPVASRLARADDHPTHQKDTS